MATYFFRAVDEESHVLMGKLRARNESDLEKILNMRRLTLIEAERTGLFNLDGLLEPRYSQKDLLDITYFLYLIVSSGIPIMGGLEDLKKQGRKKLSYVAEHLHDAIESGMSLSEGMTTLSRIFPDYYIQMIRAGEASGNLDGSLDHLMDYIESQINLRKTIKSYLIYPSIIIALMVTLVLLLFTFVFPKLVTILINLRAELPLPTRIIIFSANFMNKYFFYIIGMIIAAIITIRITSRKILPIKRLIDYLILSVPIIGDIMRKTNLSRYLKTVGMLYDSGANPETIFTLSPGVVKNVYLSEALKGITELILAGDNITQAMIKAGVFPPLITDLISMGEKTGNLDKSLKRACEIFDKEVPETIKKLFSLLEPLLIVLLGVFVLILLLSIFLPIYRIVGSIRVR
jgi:type II secretory pathway component PulF